MPTGEQNGTEELLVHHMQHMARGKEALGSQPFDQAFCDATM
jgi:hypothetical protein